MRILAEKLKDSIFLTNTGDLMSPCFNPKQSIVIPPFVSKGRLSKFFDRETFQTRDIFASFRGQTSLIKPKDPWFRYLMLYGAKSDKIHNHGKQPDIEPCFDWASKCKQLRDLPRHVVLQKSLMIEYTVMGSGNACYHVS